MIIATKDVDVTPLTWRADVGHAGGPAANQLASAAGRPQTVRTALEWCAALLLAVALAPVVALAALAVRLTSRGPAFYSQVRLGRFGKPFTLWKLRSMVHDCEGLTGPRWATPGDDRVTPVGRFLRKSHLDELPQLWNILCGDMSLIGPRPERPEFIPGLEQAVPLYRQRLLVKPGVTGLAQVQLPPDTNTESVRRKLTYDLYYVRHHGFWLDVRVVLATAGRVLGVPFATLRRVFAFPRRKAVEAHYRGLLGATRRPVRAQVKG